MIYSLSYKVLEKKKIRDCNSCTTRFARWICSLLFSVFLLTFLVSFSFFSTPVFGQKALISKPLGHSFMLAPQHFTLSNGMRVIVLQDHRVPIVTHMVWYKVGSADEKIGKTGLAHFLEHLMFKGTDKIGVGEFSRIVAEKGGNLNAFTYYDFTAYYERISKKYLPFVMKIEADRMHNLKLDDKEFQHEREVVLEERRMRVENDPYALLSSKARRILFEKSPYGEEVIGTAHDIKNLTRQDAFDFYKKYYTPNNAILIIAGDVEPDEVRILAEDVYGQLPQTSHPGKRQRTPPVSPEKPVHLKSVDARAHNTQFFRMFSAPSPSQDGQKFALALEMASKILGGDDTSRLYEEIVIKDKLASEISLTYESSTLDAAVVRIDATIAPEYTHDPKIVERLQHEVEHVIEGFFSTPPNEDEIFRAKTSIKSLLIYATDNQFDLANLYGTALTTGLNLADVYNIPKLVDSITKDDITNAAREILCSKSYVEGVLRPPLENLPPQKGESTQGS